MHSGDICPEEADKRGNEAGIRVHIHRHNTNTRVEANGGDGESDWLASQLNDEFGHPSKEQGGTV